MELATITNLLAEIEIDLTIEKDQQREIQIKKMKEMMTGFDAPKANKTMKLQYEAIARKHLAQWQNRIINSDEMQLDCQLVAPNMPTHIVGQYIGR